MSTSLTPLGAGTALLGAGAIGLPGITLTMILGDGHGATLGVGIPCLAGHGAGAVPLGTPVISTASAVASAEVTSQMAVTIGAHHLSALRKLTVAQALQPLQLADVPRQAIHQTAHLAPAMLCAVAMPQA
jgi:hypothetical protein